jgi:MFS transporter, ACS family, allantoate permease
MYHRWKTDEQPLRVGIWISGASVGGLVGQGLDFGAINIGGAYANNRWKWIYVILGSVTMGSAMIMFLLFPDTPMKAWFLTKREKDIAVQRLKTNNTGIQTRTFKWKQALEAFTDPQLYFLCVFAFAFSFVNNAFGRQVLTVSFG